MCMERCRKADDVRRLPRASAVETPRRREVLIATRGMRTRIIPQASIIPHAARIIPQASIIPHAARIIPQASIIPHAARIIPQASIIPHAARIIPQASIDRKAEVEAGSAAEVEIRAAAIVAVERIAQRLSAERAARPLSQGPAVSQSCVPPVFVDWALWAEGERRKDALPAHHRTTTTNY
eukprot:Polyplicarium_translucidae@DN2369_c0_g2_i3.p2